MKKTGKTKTRLITLTTIGVIFLAWTLITALTDISSVFLPSPKEVLDAFVLLCRDGYGVSHVTLGEHIGASMGRLFTAYALAVVFGVLLGLLSGCVPAVHAVLDPVIEFYRPLPPLAYYTLLVLWLGITETCKVTLLFLAGFAPVYLACISGVKRIPEDTLRAARMLGAGKTQIFVHVILPGVLPDLFTGLRTALGVEYSTLVAAEMVAATKGLGFMVLDAANWLRSDVVFVGVIIMGITGILMNEVLLLLEKHIVFWNGKV